MIMDRVKKVKFYIFIAIITLGLVTLICNLETIKDININTISNMLKNNKEFSIIAFLIIFIIKPIFVILPSNLLAIISGNIFGALFGFSLIMICYFISATVAFYLSRFMGKDFVEIIMGNKFMKLDKNIESRGFKILFLIRLPPVIPFDALSYACGLTKIKYKDFITASLLGIFPETICYSILGTSFMNPLSIKFIIPIIILIIGVVLAKFVILKK